MPRLDPAARDFDTIVPELKKRVRERFAHLQTDPTDAGFTAMLIDLFAAVGDGIHFQLDNALQDLFWDTVRDPRAAARLAALVGYRPKAATAATVSIRFARVLDENTDKKAVAIPERTPVATADGEIVFETTKEATLPPDKDHIDVPAEHACRHQQTSEANALPDQVIVTETAPFTEGDVALYENGKPWLCVDDFLASEPQDPHYKLTVGTDQRLRVHLGNGLHGRIPTGPLRLAYRSGGGPQGNLLAGTLNTLEQALYDTDGREVEITVTNPRPAVGGAPPETVPQIRRNALLRLRSQRRAVTAPDIVDQALAVPGVARVKLVTRDQDPRVPPHTGFLYIAAEAATSEKANPDRGNRGADEALLERVRHRFAHETPPPVGFVLHAAPAPLVPLDLSWKLWFADKNRAYQAAEAVRDALNRFLSPDGTQPWGTLPHPSQLICVAHRAHQALAGVDLITDLSTLTVKPHQIPVLGKLKLIDADTGKTPAKIT